VHIDERDAVFQELLGDFKRDALPYLAKSEFPGRFSRSKYREIVQNLYKYKNILENV
jgi:hypothetical protein